MALWLSALVLSLGLIVTPAPADATNGEPTPPDPPTSETTIVPAATDETTAETTVASETTVAGETTLAPEPAANPDSAGSAESTETIEPLDPMSQEAPGEAAPETDITVPPPEADGTEDLWEPARILWSSVGVAEQKLAETNEQRAEMIASARALRKRQKQLTVESQQLGAESAATIAELAAATERFRTRAVLGFQQFGSGSDQEDAPDFSDYQEIVDDQRRSRMVDSALKFDQVDLDRLDELRNKLDSNSRAVLDRIGVVSDHLAEVEAQVLELDDVIEQATVEYEAFLAGSQVFIHGAVFPIAPGYDTNLIDSWGFPRMVGTEDEHGHEGIDIFAPRGTPLVAAERGVIDRLGVGRLGGLKFWLRGESGSDWYYAHLDSFAPGLANGNVVEVGDLLGYVGDSGNAVGTPPHLHLQLHPGGGDPVNPYPLLQVISDIEQAAIEAGTFDDYDYPVVVSERQDPPPEPTTTSTEPAVGETEGPPEPTVPGPTEPNPTQPEQLDGSEGTPAAEPATETLEPPTAQVAGDPAADTSVPPVDTGASEPSSTGGAAQPPDTENPEAPPEPSP